MYVVYSQDDDQGFVSYGYRGPRHRYSNSDDALGGEMSLAKGSKPAQIKAIGRQVQVHYKGTLHLTDH